MLPRVPQLRWIAPTLTLLCALSLPDEGSAERRVRVYKVQHRAAEELLPLASAVLGERGNAAVDQHTNALILAGDAAAIAETLEFLTQQDIAPRSVILRYESKSHADLEAAGIHVLWSAGRGSFRIGNAVFPGAKSGAVVAPEHTKTKAEKHFASTLRVLEGRSGRIATGRSVPVTTSDGFYTSTQWVTAESGLEARPRVLSDGRIQVELQPFEGHIDAGGSVHFTGAATSVTLKAGETLVIGGLNQGNRERETSAFSGATQAQNSSEQLLLLSAELE